MAGALSIAVAFGAGLASFLAPCILPVVPGYVSFVAGGPTSTRVQRAVRTSFFVGGFSIAFVTLGLLVGAVGQSPLFQNSEVIIRRVGGALIILFGLAMTGLLHLKFMERDFRYHGAGPLQKAPTIGAAVLGASFAIGWSPCVGPILASVLLLAGSQGSIGQAALLLSVYALGLAIPFLIVGLGADRGVALIRRFGKASRAIEIGGGAILIVLGIFVFTGAISRVTSLIVPGGA